MASIYNKNGIIYISWYDFAQQKRYNKSLNLINNPKNWKIALQYKKELEAAIDKEKQKYKSLGIKRTTIADAYKHFLANNQDKHPKTIKDYNRFYNKFIETFKEEQSCSVITKIAIENWINQIKKLPQKKNSIFGYYKQLNHFLNFLFEYNYVQMFKINRDVKPKPELVEKIVMTTEDLAYVFGILHKVKKTNNFRNMIYLLYYTGLRASDIISIQIENVDINRRVLRYYSPKRKVHREISFHEDLVPIFEDISKCKTSGKILDYKDVEHLQRAIKRFFESIGLNSKNYTSRTFRKTFITLARKRGMDESVVKELVGHAHSSTTDRFYNLIDHDQMKKELTKYLRVDDLPFDKVKDRIDQMLAKVDKRKLSNH